MVDAPASDAAYWGFESPSAHQSMDGTRRTNRIKEHAGVGSLRGLENRGPHLAVIVRCDHAPPNETAAPQHRSLVWGAAALPDGRGWHPHSMGGLMGGRKTMASRPDGEPLCHRAPASCSRPPRSRCPTLCRTHFSSGINGRVTERLIVPVSKTGVPLGTVGSNPTPSARSCCEI